MRPYGNLLYHAVHGMTCPHHELFQSALTDPDLR
jgi:hypothetical protein